MSRLDEIKQRQSDILDRYHTKVCDPKDSFTYEKYRDLSDQFHKYAALLKPTPEQEDFQRVAGVFPDASGEQISRMYDNRHNVGEMIRVMYPDRPHLFN